jgi:lysophospholipase L1-like esterase
VYSLKKPADTFRIAFVGDSVVYGYGIVNEDTVSKQLEVLLNHNRRLKKKFEVINFGVPGYGTEQEVEWYLKKVKPFSPDLVIIGYCLNDSVISSWEYELFANKYFPLWSKFYSLEAVVDGVRIAVERRRFADSAPKNRAADPVFIGVKSIKDNIESVQPTLLLVIPALIPFDKYGNIDVHNRVREASAYFGVTHYDLLPIFSKYNYMDLRVPQFSFRDDTHLGRFGNKVAADAIMEWLMTKYKGKAAFL